MGAALKRTRIRTDYQMAIRLQPTHVTPWLQLATVRKMATRSTDPANKVVLSLLNTALRLQAKCTAALELRCLYYVDAGKLDLAMDDIQKALRLEPRNPNLIVNCGSLLQKLGNVAGALSCFKV